MFKLVECEVVLDPCPTPHSTLPESLTCMTLGLGRRWVLPNQLSMSDAHDVGTGSSMHPSTSSLPAASQDEGQETNEAMFMLVAASMVREWLERFRVRV